jgi:hypothetical protein
MAVDIFDGGGNPVYPDIAVHTDGSSNDITDTVSGQPNVSTPASPIPLNGWPGNGIPVFSAFNKIFRLITQWVRWLYASVVTINDTLSKDVTLTGSWTSSTLLGEISLPTGFVGANTVILGGFLQIGGHQYWPLFFNTVDDVTKLVYNMFEVRINHDAGDKIQIRYFSDGTVEDLNGWSYCVVVRKIA